jgi:hypothetical protein
MIRRLLVVAATAIASTLALAGPRVAHACDQGTCVPQLGVVTPQEVVLSGRPLHLTLQGSGLSGVTGVLFSPLVPGMVFTVYNDTTILVTLPAGTPSAVYSVRVVSPDGGSDPSSSPIFQVDAAPPPSEAPTPRPKATPRPTPVPAPAPSQAPPAPATGVVAIAQHDTPLLPAAAQPSAAPQPVSAPIDVLAGLIIGGMVYVLWGSPRRLAGSWRSNPVAHALGRPALALHVGHICLYCNRLHYIWATRRDLWRAGRYCSPKCFISAEAQSSALDDEAEESEPVMAQKKQAWWRAAVATVEADTSLEAAESEEQQVGWRPRY